MQTYRLTNPHVRIEELTVQQFSRTFRLFRTELIFEAAIRFAKLISTAILTTRLIIVHIDFVDNKALEQSRHRNIRFIFNVMRWIASPNHTIGTFHHLLQHLLRLLCAISETLAQQM